MMYSKTVKFAPYAALLCLQLILAVILNGCGDSSSPSQPEQSVPEQSQEFQFRAVLPDEFSELVDTSRVTGTTSFDNLADPQKTCLLTIGNNNFSSCDLNESMSGLYTIVVTWTYDDVNSGLIPLAKLEKSVSFNSSSYEITTDQYDKDGFQFDADGDGVSNLAELITNRDPTVFEYVSLTGTWSGTYNWDCDGRTGTAQISLQLIDDDAGQLTGQLTYVTASEIVSVTGYRFGEVQWDPWGFRYAVISATGVYFEITIPASNTYIDNLYSGTIKGDSNLTAITLNGDSNSGCSAASTASGDVTLQKVP